MADRVSPTDWPWAWNSARAWLIRLETAPLAFSESDRWAASTPTSGLRRPTGAQSRCSQCE
eukprot:11982390-Alexandrium_andersonii.AAC.1